jgi:PPK2 family polyphosphate:nucleotide phosphotransferase
MATRIERLFDMLIVPPGKKIKLAKDYDPSATGGLIEKKEAKDKLAEGIARMAEYQNRLYAQSTYSLLIIFQAMDAAGKDSTIKHVMSGLNPQGTQVYSFKAPSAEELDHTYLWRSFKALPERGNIGIFNRSYYEEVLVVRVHPEILARQQLPPKLKDKKIWQRRFREINNFERYLVDNGTIVLKFFLNLSKEEQKKRFLKRIDLREKNWKFSMADAREREYWNQYQKAYEDMLNNTSTEYAPWYVVPADNKWFMRIAVAGVIYQTLKDLKVAYPRVTSEHRQELLKAREVLQKGK